MNKPPLQQLNELASKMKMTLQYDCVSELGPPNHQVCSYAVKIGTKAFSGQAQNKKAAKRGQKEASSSSARLLRPPPEPSRP